MWIWVSLRCRSPHVQLKVYLHHRFMMYMERIQAGHGRRRCDLTWAMHSARLDLQTHRSVDIHIASQNSFSNSTPCIAPFRIISWHTRGFAMQQVRDQRTGNVNVQDAVRESIVETLSAPLYGSVNVIDVCLDASCMSQRVNSCLSDVLAWTCVPCLLCAWLVVSIIYSP
ncbi:hypothetical protein BD310DRAFT_613975 [Dichomitus squalens]|uniref:Uncharacterized protein n=1 Tax=Dichomitus squalens TaxID=114155 RepID=A0A4Q9PQ92_9APHY|nr:hypothetical protein BD310DRAFT_613975 [Dichomitus squalens]